MGICYNIIKSGSNGNCVIFEGAIAIDLGVSYKDIKQYEHAMQIVLFTHVSHGDHYKSSALKKLQLNRPSLRVGCSAHDAKILKCDGFKNIDELEIGRLYDYVNFKVSPIKLYHDVPCIGFRLFINGEKIIYCTDTAHLEGITALNYSYYFLEANYDDERIYEIIKEKDSKGEYAHQRGAVNSHLSIQQAQNFILKNAGENYRFVQLHQSNEF